MQILLVVPEVAGWWGGVMFSTPNHPQEKIFTICQNNSVYISNSLPLLLVMSQNSLDKTYFKYEEDLCSILYGLNKYMKSIPLNNKCSFNQYICCNLKIDSDLNIREQHKQSRLKFSSFDDYHGKILQVLRRIKENSTDNNRKMQYDMISTISRGYDATATSALAKEVGCDKVITFNQPIQYCHDCGTDIAKQLGYTQILEEDAYTYLHSNKLNEAESCATGGLGEFIMFSCFEEEFKNSLLFMGARGDSVWERLHDNVNDTFDFSEGNGLAQTSISYIENLLKNNTILINVPLIGADRWSDLAHISKSEEMRQYSVDDDYDRPIPRKIVEDKGVNRSSFGQKKSGAGISYHFDTFNRLAKKMSPIAFKSLKDYKKHLKRNQLRLTLYSLKYYAKESPIYINYILSKFHIPFRLSTKARGRMSSPLSSLLILWGMDIMMKRYKYQLE